MIFACMNTAFGSNLFVIWCFEPSQPQRIASGLNTNFTLFPNYSFSGHYTTSHVFFLACLYSADTQHGSLHPTGWPILFCGPTQEPCISHSQQRRNRERFWKKCRWMDRNGRYKQGRNLAFSVACLAIYWPTLGFKGRTFELFVLTRWDFNFCVRSSPLRGAVNLNILLPINEKRSEKKVKNF